MTGFKRKPYKGGPRKGSVDKTDAIASNDNDLDGPDQALLFSTPSNVTSLATNTDVHLPFLWIPYVLIALIFIIFLGANFWCYHKKNRLRYLRKRDETRVKAGLHERQRITALVRSNFFSNIVVKTTEEHVDARAELERVHESVGSTPEGTSPDWQQQHFYSNGPVQTTVVCTNRLETGNMTRV